MSHGMVVLGTDHRLQGLSECPGNVDDPMYGFFIKHLISKFSVKYIFEEAGGRSGSTAEQIAKTLGLEHNDIDRGQPHPGHDERERDYTVQGWENHRKELEESGAVEEVLVAQIETEQFWIEKIQGHSFTSGLLICGHLHTISIATRLQAARFEVTVLAYMPRRIHWDD
jgi:hypothetical protein